MTTHQFPTAHEPIIEVCKDIFDPTLYTGYQRFFAMVAERVAGRSLTREQIWDKVEQSRHQHGMAQAVFGGSAAPTPEQVNELVDALMRATPAT